MKWFRPFALFDPLLTIIFQTTCVVCTRLVRQGSLCDQCRLPPRLRAPLCDRCGIALPEAMTECGECLREPNAGLVRVRSQFWLDETARAIIHKIKYSSRFELLALFKPTVLQEFPKFFDCFGMSIVPVPLHPSKLIRRGFNQSEIIGRWLSRALSIKIEPHGLQKIKATESQSSLGISARQRNLRGSFGWNRRISVPEKILIVDDIYTTGATLRACAKAAKKAGVREVYGWTLLRTPKEIYGALI